MSLSLGDAENIVQQGAEYVPDIVDAGREAVDYALGYLSVSELAALTIIFLYSLQLTAKGRLVETVVKTLIGYLVYKSPIVENLFGPLGVLEHIAIKTVIGLLAVALAEFVLFKRKKR